MINLQEDMIWDYWLVARLRSDLRTAIDLYTIEVRLFFHRQAALVAIHSSCSIVSYSVLSLSGSVLEYPVLSYNVLFCHFFVRLEI